MERFWSKVALANTDACWTWTASLRNGYGQFWLEGKTFYAHRIAYELEIGPIPVGLVLDHLCRNRSCVNPSHLEPVTNQENAIRGETGHHMREVAANRTHCPSGHPYNGSNVIYDSQGYRRCRVCHLARRRDRYARRLSA